MNNIRDKIISDIAYKYAEENSKNPNKVFRELSVSLKTMEMKKCLSWLLQSYYIVPRKVSQRRNRIRIKDNKIKN